MPENIRTTTRSSLNGVNSNNATYSTWVGFIFIFNLIVGTGALTLPGVFAKAGWFLSLIIIILLAIISYITVTFVIEAMAAANAVKTWQNLQVLKRSYDFDSREDLPSASASVDEADFDTDDPSASLLPPSHDATARLERMPLYAHGSTLVYYKLDDKFELGEMATLFFNDFGRVFFYLCISIYLYGDLSIYSAAVAKSLRDLFCDHQNPNNFTDHDLNIDALNLIATSNDTDDAVQQCWKTHNLTRLDVYRLFLVGFTVIFGPFVAFSVQKTKYLQIITVIFRWCAFIFMISIALKLLITEGAKGHPVSMNIYGVPALFGACVYSFMCHHSLPSLLAPIRDKLAVRRILCADYIVICLFYILLAMTGIFAFERLQDLYTLNFIPDQTDDHSFKAELLVVIDYFLALFPVFTLSASFPIIAITLRNNLQTLFLDMTRFESYNFFVRRISFPLMAIAPPFTITYFTENLTSLVAFTGSYAGAGIQYIIPIALVYYARNTCRELLGSGVVNDYQSPFRSIYWLAFVLMWALGCISLVTLNFFLDTKS
ncbi:putative transmembrane protein 104 [Lucilia cuprina]|uniref:Putative transmembrane protein 104 n=1 Tax=Lucilia cuprina TaxID=7375 RepID=A0A0L0CDM1_LUCCU|nr:Transmembrane protein 104 like protein [Lucilia cuprina]KNC30312.1 putative transmembrane protein 104 [Lucilia cuprina]